MFKKKETTKAWLESMGIKNYLINKDLTVDVKGDVKLSKKNLNSIDVQFGTVSGDFDCSGNNLTSLLGAPKNVGNSFDCSANQLSTLKYCPEKVEENFYCFQNQLKTLEYAPKKIKGNFTCGHNPPLTDLKYAPHCHQLSTSHLKLQFDEYIELKCKAFVHRTMNPENRIEIFKNHYDSDPNYGFDVFLDIDEINNLMLPLKEKALLDATVLNKTITSKKLKV
jgi:hypothetical protein